MKFHHIFRDCRKWPFLAAAGVLAMLLNGCARESGTLNLTYANLAGESPASFRVCHDYGCIRQTPVSLSAAQWQSITALFAPPATNAAQERRQIAKVIAAMETLAGGPTGTAGDKPRASLLKTESGQMDCIDETLNTARYLKFFARDGLLRWHSIEQPTRRGRRMAA